MNKINNIHSRNRQNKSLDNNSSKKPFNLEEVSTKSKISLVIFSTLMCILVLIGGEIYFKKDITLNNKTGSFTETMEYQVYKEKNDIKEEMSSLKNNKVLPKNINNNLSGLITLGILVIAFWSWFNYFSDFKINNSLIRIIPPALLTFTTFNWVNILNWLGI